MRPGRWWFALAPLCVVAWFWSDVCLWQADNCLRVRNDQQAAWWSRVGSIGAQDNWQAALIRLRIARRRQQFDKVEKELKRAAELGAPRKEVERQGWLAMAQAGQYAQMERHWFDLLEDPRDDEPEIGRSFVAWASRRHLLQEAFSVLAMWHKDYPNDPEPFELRARINLAMNDLKSAEESCREAVRLAPRNIENRWRLADVLRQRLEMKESIQLYLGILKENPDHLPALSGVAQAYLSAGEMESAMTFIRQATAKHPDDLELLKNQGQIELAAGDLEAAAKSLDKPYQAAPENSDLAYSYGLALKGCGRLKEAEPLLEFAAESREHVNQLKSLEERIRRDPNDIETRLKIAAITAKYISRKDAVLWYQNLLAVAPTNRAAHAALADLYSQLGEKNQAAEHAHWLENQGVNAN